MKELLINRCFGGYTLSNEVLIELTKRKHKDFEKLYFYCEDYSNQRYVKIKDFKYKNGKLVNSGYFLDSLYLSYHDQGDIVKYNDFKYDKLIWSDNWSRDDEDLIKLFKEWGSERCSGDCSKLKLVEIPNDIEYYIDVYDGLESIHERHRSWN